MVVLNSRNLIFAVETKRRAVCLSMIFKIMDKNYAYSYDKMPNRVSEQFLNVSYS